MNQEQGQDRNSITQRQDKAPQEHKKSNTGRGIKKKKVIKSNKEITNLTNTTKSKNNKQI